jgi:tetratricopeptide (TPR) repeat protein
LAHRSVATALLALALALPAAARAADCSRLAESAWSLVRTGGRWTALRQAERCADDEGLPPADRAKALRLAATLRSIVGDAATARERLERAGTLASADAEAEYQLAATSREHPEEAAGHAEKAALLFVSASRKAAAHRLAGEARLDLNDAAGAATAFHLALKAREGDLDALAGLARAHRREPAQSEAWASRVDEGAQAAPLWYRGDALRFAARLWLELDSDARAAVSLRRALALNPDDLQALQALARVQRRVPAIPPSAPAVAPRQQAERTAEELRVGLAAAPEDLETLRALIALEREKGNTARARRLGERFLDAVRLAPPWQQASAYRLSAESLAQLGQAQKARESLLGALELDLGSLETLRVAARTFKDPRDSGIPKENLQLPDAYVAVAQAKGSLGDKEGARRLFALALELAPDNAFVRKELARFQAAP